jgi:beta-xylosidase
MVAVAVHCFLLDWNDWRLEEWPEKVASIKWLTDLAVWVTEAGGEFWSR